MLDILMCSPTHLLFCLSLISYTMPFNNFDVPFYSAKMPIQISQLTVLEETPLDMLLEAYPQKYLYVLLTCFHDNPLICIFERILYQETT